MNMSYLLELLPELLEKVFSYCSADELQNLSCCNSLHNELCKEMLWSTVTISWHCLDDVFSCFRRKQLQNLRFTSALYIYKVGRRERENLELAWANYREVLKHCDTERLHTLSITGVRIHCTTMLTCELLCNLRRLIIMEGVISLGAFEDIVKLPNLIELNLENTGRYTNDDYLSIICGGLAKLRTLNIHGNKMSDRGMEHLAGLQSLEELNIGNNYNISDSGFSHVGTLFSLKRLTASHCYRISDVGISFLRNLTLLQELDLRDCSSLTDNALEELSKLLNLVSIDISDNNINDEGLGHLSKLQFLEELNIAKTNVTDLGICYLTRINSLIKLNLSGTWVTDAAMLYLPSLWNLRSIEISFNNITDKGLKQLMNLKFLEELNISMTKITDTGISYLSSISSLYKLDLSGLTLTNTAMQYLQLSNLKELDVCRCYFVNDNGMSHVGNIQSLKYLDIRGTRVTTLGLEHLTSMRQLRTLKCDRDVAIATTESLFPWLQICNS